MLLFAAYLSLAGKIRVAVPSIMAIFIVAIVFVVIVNGTPIPNDVASIWQWRSPIVSWAFQTMILIWSLFSVALWTGLLKRAEITGRGRRYFILTITLICLTQDLFFLNDVAHVVFGSTIIPRKIVDIIATATSVRPSGLESEPSEFGAWCAFAWPMLVLSTREQIGRNAVYLCRMVALLTFLCAIASFARTFLVIVTFQTITLTVYRGILSKNFFSVRVLPLALVLIVAGLLAQHFWQYINLNIGGDASSTSRFGATWAALRMFVHHPIAGMGLGNFTSYYPTYIPDFAQQSPESSTLIEAVPNTRITTSNLLVKLAAELGLPAVIIFICFATYPLLVVLRAEIDRTQKEVLTLCWISSALNWLSQDEIDSSISLFALSYCLAAAAGKTQFGDRIAGIARFELCCRRICRHGLTKTLVPLAAVCLVAAVLASLITVKSASPIYRAERLLIVRNPPSFTVDPALISTGVPELQKRLFRYLDSELAHSLILSGIHSEGVLDSEVLEVSGSGDAAYPSNFASDKFGAVDRLSDHFRVIRLWDGYWLNAPMVKIVAQAQTRHAAQVLADVIEKVSNAFLLQQLSYSIVEADSYLAQIIPNTPHVNVKSDLFLQQELVQKELETSVLGLPTLTAIDIQIPKAVWPAPIEIFSHYILVAVLFVFLLGGTIIFFSAPNLSSREMDQGGR